MGNLYIAVVSTTGKYSVATSYGPFVHWQACADWLDHSPSLRDGYKWLIYSDRAIVADASINEANAPYEKV